MSETRISCAPLGTTQVRSGCEPESALSLAPSGSGDPAVSSSAATARAAERLPAPPGPWNRYACEGSLRPASAGASTARACAWPSSSESIPVDAIAMSRGRLITIEGIDGAGKTTLAAGLESRLEHSGVDVRLLREPGGVQAAERV